MAAHADPWPLAATIRTDATPDQCVARAMALIRPHTPKTHAVGRRFVTRRPADPFGCGQAWCLLRVH